MMRPVPIDLDPSLAFTALMNLDPDFGQRTVEEGAERRQMLLSAYYEQDHIGNLWVFAAEWVPLQKARDLGAARGTADAGHVFDGVTDEDVYRNVLTMITDQDERPLRDFAAPPRLTPADMPVFTTLREGKPLPYALLLRCIQRWEEAAAEAFYEEIARVAREHLS